MSYQRDRDQFIAQATAGGLHYDTARKLLSYATTLQRLAVAQCNGDWPADNGERKVKPCPLCEGLWVPSQLQGGRNAKAAHIQHGGRCTCGPCTKCPTDVNNLSPASCLCQHTQAKACPDCRTEAACHLALEGSRYKPVTQGDPRGAVLSLYRLEDSEADIQSGRVHGIYVPVR